jgi:hypothetical protein
MDMRPARPAQVAMASLNSDILQFLFLAKLKSKAMLENVCIYIFFSIRAIFSISYLETLADHRYS